MDNGILYQARLAPPPTSRKSRQLLRLIRAAQPITRTELAVRLAIDKSTVTETVKPLIASGILREDISAEAGERRSRIVSYESGAALFAGVNLGVRRSQVGVTTLRGDITDEIDFETPTDPGYALHLAR